MKLTWCGDNSMEVFLLKTEYPVRFLLWLFLQPPHFVYILIVEELQVSILVF